LRGGDAADGAQQMLGADGGQFQCKLTMGSSLWGLLRSYEVTRKGVGALMSARLQDKLSL